MSRDLLADVYSALDSARTTMALSSNDWSTASDFAWLWGILVGWKDDDGNPDDETLARFARRFRWSAADVERLKTLHAAVEAFNINAIGDLTR